MSKTIALIAEYNPFHLGHLHQIREIKTNFPDSKLVVILSPCFTQRGVPAIMDKYSRTKLALLNGVDLVLQLPIIGATSSAEIFARTAVGILHSVGIIDTLVFGSETPDSEKLKDIARFFLSEPVEYKENLSRNLKEGAHFAKARALAVSEILGGEYADIIDSPNNILAIEYIKALMLFRTQISFLPLERKPDYSSSTQIREKLRLSENDSICDDVPQGSLELLSDKSKNNELIFADDFSLALHQKLMDTKDFENILDGNKDLSKRCANLRDNFTTFSDFANILNTKNYTYTHIMRFLTHIMLGITKRDKEDLDSLFYAPYAGVLGVKKESTKVLSAIKDNSRIPVFTSPKEADHLLSHQAKSLYRLDTYADNLYRIILTEKTSRTYPNIYRRKFIVV